jgi:hypothetical protein
MGFMTPSEEFNEAVATTHRNRSEYPTVREHRTAGDPTGEHSGLFVRAGGNLSRDRWLAERRAERSK